MPEHEIWFAQVVTRMGRFRTDAKDKQEAMLKFQQAGGVRALETCSELTTVSDPEFISCEIVQHEHDNHANNNADESAAGDPAGEGESRESGHGAGECAGACA